MKKLVWMAWLWSLTSLFLMSLLLLNPINSYAVQSDDEGYVDTQQWHVSLAMGYGQKSNPLVGGDDIPLLILPEISYYDESVYFDNGDLGYSFIDNDRYSLSALIRLNAERAYFSFLHPSNILLGASASDQLNSSENTNPSTGEPYQVPSIDDLAKRKFAIDAGIQLNVYLANDAMLRAQWMQDVSGVYKGQNGLLEYLTRYPLGALNLAMNIGLKYKSRRLVDYYYGIDGDDEVAPLFYYQAKATLEPFVKFSAVYPLNEHWALIGLARWSALASGMTDSPVVKRQYTSTLYTGVSYAF